MAYPYQIIQVNGTLSITASSTSLQNVNGPFKQTNPVVAIGSISGQNYCFLSTSEVQPTITVKLKAIANIFAIILVPFLSASVPPDSALYSNNVNIQVFQNSSQSWISCPTIINSNNNPESDCGGIMANQVQISRSCSTSTCQLGICEIGILSVCNCAQTSFQQIDMDSSFFITLSNLITSGQSYLTIILNNVTPTILTLQDISKLTDSISLICGDGTGLSYCGPRQLIIWDNILGAQHNLATSTLFSLSGTSLSIKTKTSTDLGLHSFSLFVNLQNYASLGYFPQSASLTINVVNYEQFYNLLLNKTTSLIPQNAYIDSDGFTLPQSGNDGCVTYYEIKSPANWPSYLVFLAPSQLQVFDMGSQKSVQSVFIVIRDQFLIQQGNNIYGQGVQIIVGNDASSYSSVSNTVCFYFTGSNIQSQWLTCSQTSIGQYLWIVLPSNNYLQYSEIMAFEYYPIQVNGTLTITASTNSAQVMLPFQQTNPIVSNIFNNYCYLSNSEQLPTITVQLNAYANVSAIIVAPFLQAVNPADSSLYSNNIVIKVYSKVSQSWVNCPTILNSNQNPESDCGGIVTNQIKILRNCATQNCQLGTCQIGILAVCDCSLTSFLSSSMDPSFFTLYSTLIPSQITYYRIMLFDQPTIVYLNNVMQIKDQVSLICGDGTGLTYCGSRQLIIWDNNLNMKHDLIGSTLFSFDQSTNQLSIASQQKSDIGVHNYTISIGLLNSQITYQTTTNFSVEVVDYQVIYNVALNKVKSINPSTPYVGSNLTKLTDGVVTFYETSPNSNWPNYLTQYNPQQTVTIDLGSTMTIRSIYFSGRDQDNLSKNYSPTLKPFDITIGNYITSISLFSSWISIPSLSQQQIQLTTKNNASSATELMIYQYDFIQMNWNSLISSGNPTNLKNIFLTSNPVVACNQTCTTAYCYLSSKDTDPWVLFTFKAFVPIYAINLVPLLQAVDPSTSALYSNNIDVQILQNSSQTWFYCTPIVNSNFQLESDCKGIIGSTIKIQKFCRYSGTQQCQMGACQLGVLADCNCAASSFLKSSMDSTYYYQYNTNLIDQTKFLILVNRTSQVIQVLPDITKFVDSVSLVCGDAKGNTFCGQRSLVIWDYNKSCEINFSTSTLFKYNNSTNQIIVSTSQESDVGIHLLAIKIKLANYSSIGYYPSYTNFTVEVVSCNQAIITPSVIKDFNLTAYDPQNIYNKFVDFNDSISIKFNQTLICGHFNYTAQITFLNGFGTTLITPTVFYVDSDQAGFWVYANDFTQVGNYSVNVIGTLLVCSNCTNTSKNLTVTIKQNPNVIAQNVQVSSTNNTVLTNLNYQAINDGIKIYPLALLLTPQVKNIAFKHVYFLSQTDRLGTKISVQQNSKLFDGCCSNASMAGCAQLDGNTLKFYTNIVMPIRNFQISTTIYLYDGTYSTIPNVQNFTVTVSPCEVTSINPVQPQLSLSYLVGSGSRTYLASNFTQLPLGCKQQYLYFYATISSSQFPTAPQQFNISSKTLEFNLLVSDTNLTGKTVNYAITAQFDTYIITDCMIQIYFSGGESSDGGSSIRYQAPNLTVYPQVPPPIPCLQTNQAISWKYSFPQALDVQNFTIKFSLKCPAQINIFTQSLQQNVLTLTLDTSAKNQKLIQAGSNKCSLTLSNGQSAANYYIYFNVLCTENQIFQSNLGENATDASNDRDQTSPNPVPTIQKITNRGIIVINWNVNMKPSQKILNVLYNTTQKNSLRLLQQSQVDWPLNIFVSPGSSSQAESDYGIHAYQIIYFKERQMQVQLYFNNPSQVSMVSKDTLNIEFNNKFFQSADNKYMIVIPKPFTKSIPTQINPNIISLNIGQTSQAALYSMAASIVFSQPAFQYFANQLLSAIEPLTVICHYILINLNYPANLQDFFSQIFPIIQFDVLQSLNINQVMFNLDQINDNPYSEQFNKVGYNAILAVNTIGSLFEFMCLIPILLGFFVLMDKLLKNDKYFIVRYLKSYFQTKLKQLKWNGCIKFFFSAYLVLSMIGQLSLYDLRFGTQYSSVENFSSLLGCALFTFSIVFPIFLAIIYFKHFKPIRQTLLHLIGSEDEIDKINHFIEKYHTVENYNRQCQTHEERNKFLERLGVLLSELRLRGLDREKVIGTPLVILCGQLTIVVIVLQLQNIPALSILLLMYTVLLEICYMQLVKPYEEKLRQFNEIFNLITKLFLTYMLLLFTNYVDQSISNSAGVQFLYVTLINIGVNLLIALIPPLISLKRYYFVKRKQYLQKRKQSIADKLKERQMLEKSLQAILEEAQFKDLENIFPVKLDKNLIRQKIKQSSPSKKIKNKLVQKSEQLTQKNIEIQNLNQKEMLNTNQLLISSRQIDDLPRLLQYPEQGKSIVIKLNRRMDQNSLIKINLKQQKKNQDDKIYNQVLSVIQEEERQEIESDINLTEGVQRSNQQIIQEFKSKPENQFQDQVIARTLGGGMTNVKLWQRSMDQAFQPSPSKYLQKFECHAYICYLETRFILLPWDLPPKNFWLKELNELCQLAYENRMKDLYQESIKSRQFIQKQGEIQKRELKLEIARQVLDKQIKDNDSELFVKTEILELIKIREMENQLIF